MPEHSSALNIQATTLFDLQVGAFRQAVDRKPRSKTAVDHLLDLWSIMRHNRVKEKPQVAGPQASRNTLSTEIPDWAHVGDVR